MLVGFIPWNKASHRFRQQWPGLFALDADWLIFIYQPVAI
jgi:hypothetical protein